MNFPSHKCGLYLEHNPNRDFYMTVAEYLADLATRGEHGESDVGDWAPGEREMAIATNEIWTLQWYPDTPVGFCKVAASTLEALLTFANEH